MRSSRSAFGRTPRLISLRRHPFAQRRREPEGSEMTTAKRPSDRRTPGASGAVITAGHSDALLTTGALQSAIFNSANFSSIATDAKGVIQIFNVGAERMLGYTAAEVMNQITPADISDADEVIARARALSLELGTPITRCLEAFVFNASLGT